MATMATYLLSYLRIPLLATSGIAALASGLLYLKQNELIYPRNLPSGARTPTGVPRPSHFTITSYEDLSLPTPDGETLHAFLIHPSRPTTLRRAPVTVLMFHGNAGNIGHRVPIAKVLDEQLGCTVLMLEYRGYGLSTGTPDEEGLRVDAQTGLDYLRQREETRDSKIVVYGQSLGGAVAVWLVARGQGGGDVKGVVLENTFTSVRKLIPSAFPPARFLVGLCHQYWATEDVLPEVRDVPILFLSGLKDEIVPPSHMQHLYSVCRAKTKIWKALPNGTHSDTVAEPNYFQYIAEFIREQVLKES